MYVPVFVQNWQTVVLLLVATAVHDGFATLTQVRHFAVRLDDHLVHELIIAPPVIMVY